MVLNALDAAWVLLMKKACIFDDDVEVEMGYKVDQCNEAETWSASPSGDSNSQAGAVSFCRDWWITNVPEAGHIVSSPSIHPSVPPPLRPSSLEAHIHPTVAVRQTNVFILLPDSPIHCSTQLMRSFLLKQMSSNTIRHISYKSSHSSP